MRLFDAFLEAPNSIHVVPEIFEATTGLPRCEDQKGPKIQSLREKIAEVETRERELYEEARYNWYNNCILLQHMTFFYIHLYSIIEIIITFYSPYYLIDEVKGFANGSCSVSHRLLFLRYVFTRKTRMIRILGA